MKMDNSSSNSGSSSSNSSNKGKYSLADLEDYYKNLTKLAGEKKTVRFLNQDRAHNAVVMLVMLEHAEKRIQMYCGALSIFRENFQQKAKENINQQTSGSEDAERFDVFKKLRKSLQEFLNKDHTTFEAIIENPGDNFWEEEIIKEDLFHRIEEGKVQLYKLKTFNKDSKFNLNHFAIGDDTMYRRESDMKLHTALCCFNNEAGVSVLASNFAMLKSFSVPLT
ncbi:MAG: hypothetical protein LBL90_12110 [Prevotellaceae bacterium]|nr:hypothetical protein [Prevotellaceae bacterium]